MVLNTASELVRRIFRPKHDYLPGTTIFREIDLELVARELDLDEKAQRDGAQGVPQENATTLTVAEREVERRVRRYWEDAIQGARRAHEGYAGRWSDLTPGAHVQALNSNPDTIRSVLTEAARQEADALAELFEQHQAAARELQEFRDRERISRPPDKPKPLAVKVLVLVVAFALELFINIGAFASANEFGLAGAVLEVLAIPFLNIGVTGALVYFGARNVLRRGSLTARIMGALSILAAILFVVGFNLMVAHLRDMMAGAAGETAGHEALGQIQSHPFKLASINSYVLWIVGMVAGGLGAVEACIWNDPYPGYGKRASAEQQAAAEFNARRAHGARAITQLAHKNLEELRNSAKSVETAIARRPEFESRINSLVEDLNAYRQHLIEVADHLCARYREGNVRARKTPAPTYFNEKVLLDLPAVSLDPIGATERRVEIEGLLEKAIQTVTSAKDDALSRLPTLSDLKKSA